MTEDLARLPVRDLPGVFAARGLGRELAARLGLDHQDQVRVATTLSEVCRSAVTVGLSAVITFGADQASLVLTVTVDGEPPADGLAAAARLMDTAVTDGRVIRMTKRRPAATPIDLDAVREGLAALLPESTLDEVRRNNEDLIAALEDLRQQKEQLLLLNAELQETNRGVMALYSELSEELEQTNRGVVALYRELDEKSEQLKAASESKNRFWANVSHELRSPLNSVIGLTRDRAAVPGRADQELHRDAPYPRQRPARRGQGRVRAARHRPGRGQPAAAAGHLARAGPADDRGQAGRGDGQRGGGPRDRADRRGGAYRHPAQPAVQRDQVHRPG
jgi:signal transduction histidine kinase